MVWSWHHVNGGDPPPTENCVLGLGGPTDYLGNYGNKNLIWGLLANNRAEPFT